LVLGRKKFAKQLAFAQTSAQELLASLQAISEWVSDPPDLGRVVPDDPKDDWLIACAVGGRADYIISGDKHLLDMVAYKTLPIISADALLQILFPEESS
jgi:uncharacterized protein